MLLSLTKLENVDFVIIESPGISSRGWLFLPAEFFFRFHLSATPLTPLQCARQAEGETSIENYTTDKKHDPRADGQTLGPLNALSSLSCNLKKHLHHSLPSVSFSSASHSCVLPFTLVINRLTTSRKAIMPQPPISRYAQW